LTSLETISKISFFNTLTPEQKDQIASISIVTKYQKNNVLYYESYVKENLLFLVSGLLKIFKLDKFDNEIFLYHIYKDSMISELSSTKQSDIYCFSNAAFIEDSVVLSINFQKFQELFLFKNILTMELMEILLEKTHQLQCIVNRELVFDATAKVAFMLNQDLDMFNKLKRQEVSFMLHIQPETLSRVLKKLSRNKTIEIDNGEVKIKDEISLRYAFKGVGI
jgi:CRP/FNR family transcriptional regulator